MDKQNVEFCWAIIRNEVLIQATIWITLENVLSERNKSQGPHIIEAKQDPVGSS